MFHVEKNRWHCYGACAKGGSAIDLLLMGEIAFKPLDAAKTMAQKFGMEVDEAQTKSQRLDSLAICRTSADCPKVF